MFGDMLGNFQEKQEKMKEALTAIIVEAEAGDGAVKVQANAAREILNISIDKEKVALDDTEELEDLLVVAMNRVIQLASEKEAEESQKMVSNILPPGMEGLTDMFK
jgi:DNA-binding YbaB/EbfC family protein